MLDNYHLVAQLARERHREFLRQAEEERRSRLVKSGIGKERYEDPFTARPIDNRQENETAEQLGPQLGRLIYCCYCELLERGFPQERAVELTKVLVKNLSRPGCRGGSSQGGSVDYATMLCYH